MTHENALKLVNELVSQLFEIDVPHDQKVIRKEIAAWDSYKNVELMMLLEEKFGVQFEDTDVIKFEDTYSIASTILRHVS